MGTPEFAETQLRYLYENREEHNWELVGVMCQPDKPKGRGYKLVPPPAKMYAESVGLPVYQPETLRDEAFASLLCTLSPDLIVVAAYGKLLPKSVLCAPPLGCINVHGSLLPAYRGAAPIQRAIMDGCTETGVAIQYMAEGLDTGDIIDTCTVSIGPDEDFGSLYGRMAEAGGTLLIRVIEGIEAGEAARVPQGEEGASYAHKIEKSECAVSFDTDAGTLHNKIRGLSPSPLAFAVLVRGDGDNGEKKTVKLVSSRVLEPHGVHGDVGEVLSCDPKAGVIAVACREGVIGITALVPEGKGRQTAGDFIRGRKISAGDKME